MGYYKDVKGHSDGGAVLYNGYTGHSEGGVILYDGDLGYCKRRSILLMEEQVISRNESFHVRNK